MKSEIFSQIFSTSLELPIHTPVLYWTAVIVAITLVLHTAISLVRYCEGKSRRERRYLRFLSELGITQAERNCLEQCSATLGIKDKFAMLTMPSQFKRVLRWAKGHYGREILVSRIQEKLEGNQSKSPGKKPPRERSRKRFTAFPNAA